MTLELNHSQQSQASSIESAASRDFHRRPTSSHDSPPGSRSQTLRESTPSTSLSNQSSQQRVESLSPIHSSHVSESEKLYPNHGHSPSYPVESSAFQQPEIEESSHYKSPPKRTASGQVKSADNGHWASPKSDTKYGHSRNTSTASKASQVSDLSHELRTRLSYAMFKVQNGWQSHNLNELEAMTLPRNSPPSGVSQLQDAAGFPTSPAAHSQHPSEKLRSIQHSPPAVHSAYGHPHPHRVSTQLPSLSQPILNGISPQYSPHRGPSLAPPVDILSRNSRQSYATNIQPPHLDTTNLHQDVTRNLLSPSTSPSTPSRRPAPAIRTPSQKADAEKDAVETLMFMSSPGNSGYHPAFHGAITSPIRDTNTMSPTKRVGLTSPNPNRASAVGAGRLTTAADIDRVLDEMPNRYSSSDEE